MNSQACSRCSRFASEIQYGSMRPYRSDGIDHLICSSCYESLEMKLAQLARECLEKKISPTELERAEAKEALIKEIMLFVDLEDEWSERYISQLPKDLVKEARKRCKESNGLD